MTHSVDTDCFVTCRKLNPLTVVLFFFSLLLFPPCFLSFRFRLLLLLQEGAGATNQAPVGKDASLGSAGGKRSPRGEGSAGGSGRTSRARPMSRASTGGWDSESNFGFDSDDSVDYADEAGGGTTLFANVKGAWDFRSKVAASPEKESDRFIHRRLSSALLNANTN